MVQLYGLGEKKERATPDITIDRLEGEVVDQAEKKRFRSAFKHFFIYPKIAQMSRTR